MKVLNLSNLQLKEIVDSRMAEERLETLKHIADKNISKCTVLSVWWDRTSNRQVHLVPRYELFWLLTLRSDIAKVKELSSIKPPSTLEECESVSKKFRSLWVDNSEADINRVIVKILTKYMHNYPEV